MYITLFLVRLGAVPALDPAHIAWSDAYGMHTKNDVPLATVQALLKAGQPVSVRRYSGYAVLAKILE